MNIGSGMNTVSSLYGQQKGNHMKTPASGEKKKREMILILRKFFRKVG